MHLPSNVGKIDAIIRLIVGIVLIGVIFVVESPWRWLGLIGLIPIITALFGFCPLWQLLGINTSEHHRPGGEAHHH